MEDNLYNNLLRATDNTNDITTEKYATITQKNGNTYNVKETTNSLDHFNVPSVCSCKVGDIVILGFVENDIYNPIIMGVLGYSGEDLSIYELIENKVSSWSPTTNNSHYPTEKLVKDSLDSKISKSSINGLVKNDGTIDTNIYATIQNINSLNIGVENLILNTREFTHTVGSLTGNSYRNCAIRRIDNSNSSSYLTWTWDISAGEYEYGDCFTLGFYAKGTPTTTGLRAYFYNGVKSKPIKGNYNSSTNQIFGDGLSYFDLTNNWKRFTVTWELDTVGNLETYKRLGIRVMNGVDMYCCGVKLERGEYATDYSPSSLD